MMQTQVSRLKYLHIDEKGGRKEKRPESREGRATEFRGRATEGKRRKKRR